MDIQITRMRILILAAGMVLLWSCGNSEQPVPPTPTPTAAPVTSVVVEVPEFSADSAMYFVEQQVAFGPRVPGTKEHLACRDWLVSRMSSYAGSENVRIQQGRGKLFNGNAIDLYNIIVSLNPTASRRILLMAHWDTRLFADHDPDSGKREQPVLGANDGGSGVAVLMEIARLLGQQSLQHVGVDIILVDAEDQGTPDNLGYRQGGDSYLTWCLGSQYWSRNRHRSDATYQFGILLDMVGAANAVFPKEGYSRQYAPRITDRIWRQAATMGYSNYFLNQPGKPILDDHYFVNTIANIPMVDIIHYDAVSGQFGETWHTHDDNLEVIDRAVMMAVGRVVLYILLEEDALLAPV